MSVVTQEARIILAIEAIRSSKKLSRRKATEIYKVPESSLRCNKPTSRGVRLEDMIGGWVVRQGRCH
jgi:hypothetical protein